MSPLFFGNYAKLANHATIVNHVLDFIIMFYAILGSIGNHDNHANAANHDIND